MLDVLKALWRAPHFEDEEENRVARILHVILFTWLTAATLVSISSFLAGNLKLAVTLLISDALMIVAYALLRKRSQRLMSLLFLSLLLFVVFYLLYTTQGIHDVGVMTYPMLIIVASLLLNHRDYIFYSVVTILSALWMVFAEVQGYLVTSFAGATSYNDIFIVATILTVAAVSLRLMAGGLRRSLNSTRTHKVELEQTNRALEARNAELERFTYMISHDLKSPLVTIQGFIGFLEQDLEQGHVDRVKDDLSRIQESAKHMHHLLADLLKLSREGHLVRPSTWIRFEELVEAARERLESHIVTSRVNISVMPSMPEVYVDRPRMVEVLVNLIDNGIKYTTSASAPTLFIGMRKEGEGHVFYVQDNGIGIPPRYAEKVFGLFERLDPTMEGTGVGLALVKRIIELHDGRVWMESEGMGRGVTVCFTLGQGPDRTESEPFDVGVASGTFLREDESVA